MRFGLIVCGALGREVKEIVRKYGWDAEVIGVPPEDHMFPMRIAPDVEERIEKLSHRCDRIAVAYGECGTRGTLDEVLKRQRLLRIDAWNCYEMYAGKKYHELLQEERGTFFLTDFLVRTFHRAVIQVLGLDRYPELKNDYFHNCKRLVYLIQKDDPELRREAQAIADFMELPLLFHITGYEGLEERVRELFNHETNLYGSTLNISGDDRRDTPGDELLICY